ncbi:hypothetical protein MesoLj131a_41390 [Mesorhizobium sp. 131-2-1]|nr:hypothetical protein MesoLj131a_41390 [Mesorhizobium sp. 131-2-1]
MPLKSPTARKAERQLASASASSERAEPARLLPTGLDADGLPPGTIRRGVSAMAFRIV